MADELIKVPDIGGAEGAEVVEVLVSPGETIAVEQSLVVVESDKASMEIPAPIAGVVSELRVAVGGRGIRGRRDFSLWPPSPRCRHRRLTC